MNYLQPSYPNPFKKARQLLRMSQDHVAEAVGLSRLFVIRTEQGVYPTPSIRLVDFFTLHLEELTGDYLLKDYREYQRRCRLTNGPAELFSPLPSVLSGFWTAYNNTIYGRPVRDSNGNLTEDLVHPFRYWMNQSLNSNSIPTNSTSKGLSVMQVCKAYCISPSLMQRFLQDTYMVHTVPTNISEALLEAGYSREVVDSLDIAYKRYRSKLYNLEENKLEEEVLYERSSS